MPLEETGNTRVRTDCLNFDVSLCMQLKKQVSIRAVLFNLFVIAEPPIYFPVCHEAPLTKIEEIRITCKKIKYVVSGHFNKQTVTTEVKKQEIY